MRAFKRRAAALAALPLLVATAAHAPTQTGGSFGIAVASGPYVSGSRIPLKVAGAPGHVTFTPAGSGAIVDSVFHAPDVRERTIAGIIGAAQGALAYAQVEVVPAPAPSRALIAVAAYENGIALHDARTFALVGYVGIGGPPGDVAFTPSGDILAPDTDGTTMAWVQRAPWQARFLDGIALGNEVAWDPGSSSALVSNRDINGMGALTRVARDGATQRTVTGVTAEGLALNPSDGSVYVGNVNDASIAQIDARTMTVIRRMHSADRTFGIAYQANRRRLYAVANISADMHSGKGFVEALSTSGSVLARSAGMTFPLGVALNEAGTRAFVTDEASSVVYVLDGGTLKKIHAPLPTCSTPWRPRVFHGRLYVPCARAGAVDVFDVGTLRRVRGAPFATGGFPLSVAVWP